MSCIEKGTILGRRLDIQYTNIKKSLEKLKDDKSE